jgi:hypothetical protein
MPRPPALLTAAANSGVVAPPMGACWIGTRQPTSSVNAVANMAEVWQDLGVAGRSIGPDWIQGDARRGEGIPVTDARSLHGAKEHTVEG